MRFALLAVLWGGVALAAPRAPVVAFFPPTANDVALQQLALLMEARASELVEEAGKVSELHLKQVVSAMREEGFQADLTVPQNVEALRQAVGADKAVAFSLEAAGEGLLLTGVLVNEGQKPKPFTTKLPKGWGTALNLGSVALAKTLLGGVPLPKKLTAQPDSTNEEALRALGACYQVVLRQPLSVETPALLDPAELERAAASCARAVELDPQLRFAQATEALARAILGHDAAAAKVLATLAENDDVLEVYTLARFWLLTRYQSNEAGVAFLTATTRKHPGELLALSYLGETQFALGAWAEAEKTFQRYLALAPASPWAWGRLSKALARQQRHDEAVTAAKKGFALSPTSPEARLELGSRLIDAGKPAEAEDILEPLSLGSPPRAEHLLRLGWANWLQKDAAAAGAYFQRAADLATAPGEWRTRGRAFYDLALVAMSKGKKDVARASLKAALQTGLKLRELDPSLAPLARELERAELAGRDAGAAAPGPLLPREASLFPVDAFGEQDVTAKKPPAPAGLVLFKF